MAGFFIYSLDSSAFESLTTTPTLEQGLILADALLEELEDLLDELDGEATPETWPLEREELAVLIQKRLASSDWYSGLSPGDANIWAFTLRRLMYEAGEKLGVDFRCDNDGFLYWDAAKIAAKHGAPMMGEPVFGGSGYRYLGQPRGEQDLNYSIYLPEKTRQLLGQLESAASHFETLPDEEDGDRDQFFRGLLEPVRIIVADNRVMWVQTGT